MFSAIDMWEEIVCKLYLSPSVVHTTRYSQDPGKNILNLVPTHPVMRVNYDRDFKSWYLGYSGRPTLYRVKYCSRTILFV